MDNGLPEDTGVSLTYTYTCKKPAYGGNIPLLDALARTPPITQSGNPCYCDGLCRNLEDAVCEVNFTGIYFLKSHDCHTDLYLRYSFQSNEVDQ